MRGEGTPSPVRRRAHRTVPPEHSTTTADGEAPAGPPAAGDVALACLGCLVDELWRGGVRRAVVSPGSRSGPVALALAHHPGIAVDVVVDERVAGYAAVGMARATGEPVAVACTSGTAVANLHPAVVEADTGRVPIVLLTADRPPDLHDVGANQTISQDRLFGPAVRWAFTCPVPSGGPGAARLWRSLGARAVAEAVALPPGPVHLDLPLAEPLDPTGAVTDLGPEAGGRPEGRPWQAVVEGEVMPSAEAVRVLRERLECERGLVVVGGLREPAPGLLTLAARVGWPVLAEPHSNLRLPGTLEAGSLVAGIPAVREELRPQVVLQIGAAPTARSTAGLVAAAREVVVVDPDDLVADPGRRAALRVRCHPELLVARLLDDLGPARTTSWSARWKAIDRAVRDAVDAVLDGFPEVSEERVARDLGDALPDGCLLVAGSSLPIRHLDAHLRPRPGLRLLANRGASGIDGVVSTTLGAAIASGAPTAALVGDLGLLHDLGALVWLGRRQVFATIVVLENGGGGIFELLGHRHLPEFEELFATAPDLDVAAVGAALGVPVAEITDPAGTGPVVADAMAQGGVRLVVAHSDRRRLRERQRAIAEAAADAARQTLSAA